MEFLLLLTLLEDNIVLLEAGVFEVLWAFFYHAFVVVAEDITEKVQTRNTFHDHFRVSIRPTHPHFLQQDYHFLISGMQGQHIQFIPTHLYEFLPFEAVELTVECSALLDEILCDLAAARCLLKTLFLTWRSRISGRQHTIIKPHIYRISFTHLCVLDLAAVLGVFK